ncbi:uncharacterized protein C56G2.4-like [Amphiura filiformis]|uniref:uncharacterized protein C56G2.4-like n=1 Tax=Amphiura filiformis TaxID=82378 RepID=UPI003B227625
MEDKNAFWFGYNYLVRCPLNQYGLPQYNIECGNFDPTTFSLADRLFRAGGFNATTITSYLDVVIHEKPGSYEACGHSYTSEGEADHTLDPINPEVLTPWQASYGFTASVQGIEEPNALYTLIIVDGGFFFLHGVYVDIPGNNFDIKFGKPISEYGGPSYNKDDPPNPYVFLLFRQESFFEAFDQLPGIWVRFFQQQTEYGPQIASLFKLLDFANDLKLVGPVAVNWLMSRTDPYAAQSLLESRIANICPMFVEQAAREYGLARIPDDAKFSVSVFMAHESVGRNFSVCCNNYAYEDQTYYLDPIGDGFLAPFDFKDPPAIKLVKMKLVPLPTDFIGEYYTLLQFIWAPNFAEISSPERPFMKWMVTNIPFGRVDMGNTVLPYFAPVLTTLTVRPQTMLYKQTKRVRINPFQYTPDCTDAAALDRCLFEMDRFVEENELELVGANWFTSSASGDASIALVAMDILGLSEADACAYVGVSGPCGATDAPITVAPITDAPTPAAVDEDSDKSRKFDDGHSSGSGKGRRRP